MVTVLGLGNVLMGDDAFGPWVVQLLDAGWSFPPHVRLLDAGTPGLDLVPHLIGAKSLIIADTVRTDAPPGTLRVYSKDDLLRTPPLARVSPHDPGLKDTLLTLRLHGDEPAYVSLVGVVPERTETGTGMSDTLMAALPAALALVLGELARIDIHAWPRARRQQPDIWWERNARSRGATHA